jgi:hypothetical protein
MFLNRGELKVWSKRKRREVKCCWREKEKNAWRGRVITVRRSIENVQWLRKEEVP